ncbi:MAG: hypothetical protein ACHP7K_00295 [Actinomycetales bacterium]
MSAVAQFDVRPLTGSTAEDLDPDAPLGAPDPARRRRTPLSLVTSAPRRRRAPFVVFCFLTLVAALATVLVLNISVSTGQYELVRLHAQQADLLKGNQELTQQVQNNQAPQNLVNKAADLGMVTSTTVGQIDLKTMTVSGTPVPAPAGDKTKSLIAAAVVGGAAPADTSSTTADPTVAGPTGAGTPAAAGPQVGPASGVDLHGGTIPAPQQKNG